MTMLQLELPRQRIITEWNKDPNQFYETTTVCHTYSFTTADRKYLFKNVKHNV